MRVALVRRSECVPNKCGSTPTGEQIVAWLLVGSLHILVDCLPCCLGQFELDRPAGLPLPDASPINRITARCNVIDLKFNDIATTKLAIDGEIEESKVADTTLHLKLGPDRPKRVWGAVAASPQ